MIGHEIVEFDDLASTKHQSEFSETFRRGNFGIIAWFRHQTITDRKVMVCNVHLFWNPKFEYVKLCQAYHLSLRVKKIQQKFGYEVASKMGVMPVILCGDFNSLPDSQVYRFFTSGCTWPSHNKETNSWPSRNGELEIPMPTNNRNQQHPDWNNEAKIWLTSGSVGLPGDILENPLQPGVRPYARFKSAYGKKEKIKFTSSTPNFMGVIDYIFYHEPTLKLEESSSSLCGLHMAKYLFFHSVIFPAITFLLELSSNLCRYVCY